ncbi:MAG: glycosyltransferase involved in cell wall biosynthesis [Psychroserpens sp.]
MLVPKISIITPSYNQGQYIEQTILSVLDQNYPNLEYIIIDGGSNDNSVEIIKKYDKYLSYSVSEPDRGHCHAINKGLKKCTGEIFNWLNSDDYYETGALHKVSQAFIEDESLHIVGGRERAFLSETNVTERIYDGTKIDGDIYELIYQGIIDQPTTFWKMDVINQLGELPESLHYTMDSYWWTKYLLMYGVQNVKRFDDILTNFRLHKQSKTILNQNKFDSNRFAIRLALAKQFRFAKEIIYYFEGQTNIDLDPELFDIPVTETSINRLGIESNFALHVYPRYYMQKEYKATQILFNKAFTQYKNGRMLLDLIKLRVIPRKILEILRP